jgi:hypothetical protein
VSKSGEEIIEIMGHATAHPPKQLQFLCAKNFVLQPDLIQHEAEFVV